MEPYRAEIAAAIEMMLEAVAVLDEDRIIRHLLNAVQSAVRTNFYQPGPENTAHKAYLSCKVQSAAVPDMPLPYPAEKWPCLLEF